MLGVAMTGETDHPLLVRIAQARKINLLCGGTVIRPWDDDTFAMLEITGWLDAFRAMLHGAQPMQAGMRKIAAAKAAILAKHPTYRKH